MIANSFERLVQSWVESFLARNRGRLVCFVRESDGCSGCLLCLGLRRGLLGVEGGRSFMILGRGGASVDGLLLRQLVHAELEILDLRHKSILFQLHQHLFFHDGFVLVGELVVGALKLILLLLLLTLVVAKLRFLLLDSPVVDLLEISLLAQLVVR